MKEFEGIENNSKRVQRFLKEFEGITINLNECYQKPIKNYKISIQ